MSNKQTQCDSLSFKTSLIQMSLHPVRVQSYKRAAQIIWWEMFEFILRFLTLDYSLWQIWAVWDTVEGGTWDYWGDFLRRDVWEARDFSRRLSAKVWHEQLRYYPVFLSSRKHSARFVKSAEISVSDWPDLIVCYSRQLSDSLLLWKRWQLHCYKTNICWKHCHSCDISAGRVAMVTQSLIYWVCCTSIKSQTNELFLSVLLIWYCVWNRCNAIYFWKWPIMVQAFVVHYIEPYYSYYTVYTLLLLLFTQTKSLNPVQSIKRKKKKKRFTLCAPKSHNSRNSHLFRLEIVIWRVNVNGHVLMK